MMKVTTQALTLWRSEHSLLTLEDLAKAVGLHAELVDTFVRYRLVEPMAHTGSCPLFPSPAVDRLQRVLRLRHDLGVNLAGVAVILRMTEQIEDLRRQLKLMRSRG